MKGYYRFVEQPLESEITRENILAPHRQRTLERMRAQKTVLAIMDGTSLNDNRRPACTGLQAIGTNQTKAEVLGIHLHATLVITDKGMPLGGPRCGFDESDTKKTDRWLLGLRDMRELVEETTHSTTVIATMDREGDLWDIFVTQRE